jgi:RNA recognition motif-containing protein
VQWQELKDLFRQAGTVQRADVSIDYQGRSRGFGQVVMANPEEAQNAIKLLNGSEIQGRVIEVREDKYAAEAHAASGSQVFIGNVGLTCRSIFVVNVSLINL